MKKSYWTIVIVVLILVVVLVLRGNENLGVVKNGVVGDVREEIASKQASAVLCALELYRQADAEGMNFSSQCLGICGDFVVDVVHNPRDESDDQVENQCEDYRSGNIGRFIELDQEGNIVKIV